MLIQSCSFVVKHTLYQIDVRSMLHDKQIFSTKLFKEETEEFYNNCMVLVPGCIILVIIKGHAFIE